VIIRCAFLGEFLIIFALGQVFGISLVVRYLRNPNPHITVRLLRAFGAVIGDGTTIKRSFMIDNAYEDQNSSGDFRYLTIGQNCYIGDGVYVDLSNEVILADNVVVSGHASFLTHTDCNRSTYLSKQYPRQCKPIQVNQGAWIGFGATILAGVTIDKYAVIAAHALVNQDVESKVVYAGIPAKKIKKLEDKIS
jgi:carbonic anhydrase/acetyltransferase-like protein (isoleucine patch superfamily)